MCLFSFISGKTEIWLCGDQYYTIIYTALERVSTLDFEHLKKLFTRHWTCWEVHFQAFPKIHCLLLINISIFPVISYIKDGNYAGKPLSFAAFVRDITQDWMCLLADKIHSEYS